MHYLKIEGQYLSVPVTPYSPVPFGRLATMEIIGGYELDMSESVDVTTPGACLIELPGGERHVARISEGRIEGPATLLQIDGLWPEEAAFDDQMILGERHRLAGDMPQDQPERAGKGALQTLLMLSCGLMALTSVIAVSSQEMTDREILAILCAALLNFGLFLHFSGVFGARDAVIKESA